MLGYLYRKHARSRSDETGTEQRERRVDETPPEEVVELLRALIRFDTTNWGDGRSAGERDAAKWIAAQLTAVGFEPVLLARTDAPGRANLVLRVPGIDRSLPALLVHAHLDVVPAEPEQWTRHPFGAGVADGRIWGRGALDMKDMCASVLSTLLHWGRSGERPTRDVVVAFVADEEDRGEFGAAWLVAEHSALFAGVEAAVGESGGSHRALPAPGGTVDLFAIAAAERGTMHMVLTARGRSGHASRPTGDDAVRRLLDALHRIATHAWPIHLSPAVRAYLDGVATALGIPADLDSDAGVQACVEALGEHADVARFTVRASSTPTMMTAGYKVNVIPGIATAAVDVRCPPGFEQALPPALAALVGDDVSFVFTHFEPPVQAPVDSPWFAAISAAIRRALPDALVVPFCMGGGTDAKAFSRLGIACYGFAPHGPAALGSYGDGVHGVDENISIDSLRWGATVLQDFLTTV